MNGRVAVRALMCEFVLLLLAVINVTLPDEKQNYVHRIGRVGRAERSVNLNLNLNVTSETDEKAQHV